MLTSSAEITVKKYDFPTYVKLGAGSGSDASNGKWDPDPDQRTRIHCCSNDNQSVLSCAGAVVVIPDEDIQPPEGM